MGYFKCLSHSHLPFCLGIHTVIYEQIALLRQLCMWAVLLFFIFNHRAKINIANLYSDSQSTYFTYHSVVKVFLKLLWPLNFVIAGYKFEHCWYIEPRNREKSLTLIWQRFSCLLDEWIAKISKKFFFHGGFLR